MKTRQITCCVFLFSAGLILCGCQGPTSFETSVLLVPAANSGNPDKPAAEPVNPLDVLAAVEKIAANADLHPYHTDDEEASLLDMTNADLLGDTGSHVMNVTEYKHPELAVYLTVTRKREEILILLNYTSDTSGKYNPQAEKLFQSTRTQLIEMLND